MAKIDTIADLTPRALGELKAWLEPWFGHGRGEKGTAGTGGGSSTPTSRDLLVCWSGVIPTVLGNGTVWRVPYDNDGSTFTFTLARAFARIETPFTSAISFRLEKSAGGDVVFAPTTITSITIPLSEYETEITGLSTVVHSGDLIRLVFTAVGGISPYHVELIGGT